MPDCSCKNQQPLRSDGFHNDRDQSNNKQRMTRRSWPLNSFLLLEFDKFENLNSIKRNFRKRQMLRLNLLLNIHFLISVYFCGISVYSMHIRGLLVCWRV